MVNADCNDQANTFVIRYLWPSFEFAGPSNRVVPYERKIQMVIKGKWGEAIRPVQSLCHII